MAFDCCGDCSNRVSRMPVGLDHDHGADTRREHVLALRQLRRDLECLSAQSGADWSPSMAVGACEFVRRLEELIAAIDRRVPRAEEAGEAAIAREAAALRTKVSNAWQSRPPSDHRCGRQGRPD